MRRNSPVGNTSSDQSNQPTKLSIVIRVLIVCIIIIKGGIEISANLINIGEFCQKTQSCPKLLPESNSPKYPPILPVGKRCNL